MKYLQLDNDDYLSIPDDVADSLAKIDEFDKRGTRLRGAIVDEASDAVVNYLEAKKAYHADQAKQAEIKLGGIVKLAKYAGLDDAEVRAVFGEVNGG